MGSLFSTQISIVHT